MDYKFIKYTPKTLFDKLSTSEKNVILKAFYLYYLEHADNPTKYDKDRLDSEAKDHMELYNETRMFNDRELVTLVGEYFALALEEDVWAKKYPEWFI